MAAAEVTRAALLVAVALGAPGAAGVLLGRDRGPAARVVQALAGALLANVTAAVALRLLDVEPTQASYAAALVAVTVAAGAIGVRRGGRLPDPRRAPAATVIFVIAFALAAWAGLDVVPALEDQDSEVQGTAWGLLRDFEPICLTNRSTLHYFAHPPLLHVFAAATLALSGELPAVRAPYDGAKLELEKISAAERRGVTATLAALRGETLPHDYSVRWARDVYGAFLRDPALLGTRAPNFALAGVAAALLFLWMRRLGVAAAEAALVVAVYATLPEIFVRSAYGGYYAIGAVTWLAGAWLSLGVDGGGRNGFSAEAEGHRVAGFAVGDEGGRRTGFLAGALAALADQKAILLGGALVVVVGVRGFLERSRSSLARAMPFVLGVAAATLAFWTYGLAVAPRDFVIDHVQEHLLARFAGDHAAARPGQLVYPSRGELWVEFAQHFGPWAVLAAAAVVVGIVRTARRTHSAGKAAPLLVAWVVAVAVAFTLTDWRQTKHLALLVPAATLLIGVMMAATKSARRWAIRIALLGALVWNVGWIARLARDFEAMSVSTLW